MDTKQYFSVYDPWDVSFLDNVYFMVLIRNGPNISIKIYII